MDSLIIVLVIIIAVAIAVWQKHESPESKGTYGEITVAAAASAAIQKGLYGRVLRNVFVPRDDGSTSELDVVLICVKGIFVFESKNFAGYIFGNEQNKNWTVSLYAGKNWIGAKTTDNHHFYNPIWQNKTHIKALRNLINTSAPINSVIVFSNRGELKEVAYDSSKTTIINSDQLKHFMRDVRISFPDVLSTGEVDRLSEIVSQYVGTDAAVKQAHIDIIRKKAVAPEVCPWCGGKLVIRTAKKGAYAGNQFYGCSNYPKCKYTRNKD